MGAVNVPLEIARQAAEVFEKLGQLEPMAGPSMLSDVRVGRMMAATAVRGALENVAINLAIDHRRGLCQSRALGSAVACVTRQRKFRSDRPIEYILDVLRVKT